MYDFSRGAVQVRSVVVKEAIERLSTKLSASQVEQATYFLALLLGLCTMPCASSQLKTHPKSWWCQAPMTSSAKSSTPVVDPFALFVRLTTST